METKKYRGGAPRKIESELRDRIVRVLFTDTEYKRLMDRKASTKAVNLSHFIRTVCLDKPMRMKPQLTTHQEQITSIVKEIRLDILRIGVNINQSSKRINSTTDYQDLQRDVNCMAAQLAHWEAQLDCLIAQVNDQSSASTPTHGSPDQ